uniref:Uncharacterized protein n=1 Tax=Solanum lycopersicum TaxID=4081 RepID=A0A3Q7G6Z7_SOLLC
MYFCKFEYYIDIIKFVYSDIYKSLYIAICSILVVIYKIVCRYIQTQIVFISFYFYK